jgi:hypothetical protein
MAVVESFFGPPITFARAAHERRIVELCAPR